VNNPQKPRVSSKSAYTTEVPARSTDQRLDNYLLRVLKGVPRAHVYRLIRSGQVRVNSGRVDASYRLKAGDRVRVPPVTMSPKPPLKVDDDGFKWLEKRILHEDDRILVLDKPAGLAVHGGSGVSIGCIEALRCLRPKDSEMDLVHRLDRGTSGCLLVAKRRSTLRALHRLLREGGMEKRYLALLKGVWVDGDLEVRLPLSKDSERGAAVVKVDAAGKVAVTRFHLLETYAAGTTLMELAIPTGRTHQIRVHAAHLGYPIAGDPRYGDTAFNIQLREEVGLQRMFLHAHALSFKWPSDAETFTVSAPLPDDLELVQRLLASKGSKPNSRNT
jgi:23S rRNA pseudouridine955/2504/2580 synthase